MKHIHTSKADETPDGFDAWWAVWRPYRRDSDSAAKCRVRYAEAIQRANSPDDILNAAKWHIEKRREKGSLAYIQLGASWLYQDVWKDDLADKADYEARIEKARQQASLPSNVQELRPSGYKTSFLRAYEAEQAKAGA